MKLKMHKLTLEVQWSKHKSLTLLDLIPLGLSVMRTKISTTIYLYLFPFCVTYHEELV